MSQNLLEHAPEVEAYVSEMTRQFGRMPAEERAEMQEELRQHLDAMVAAYIEAGTPPAEAVRCALSQFGNPKRLGKKLRREWQLGQHSFELAAVGAGAVATFLMFVVPLQVGHALDHNTAGMIFAFLVRSILAIGLGYSVARRRPHEASIAALSGPGVAAAPVLVALLLVLQGDTERGQILPGLLSLIVMVVAQTVMGYLGVRIAAQTERRERVLRA